MLSGVCPVNDEDRILLARIEERFTERFAALWSYIRQLDENQQAALQIAKRELERRLDHLNGETARMAKLQETLAGRELTDQRFADLGRRLELKAETLGKRLDDLVSDVRLQQGKMWFPLLVAAGTGAAAASIVVSILIQLWWQ